MQNLVFKEQSNANAPAVNTVPLGDGVGRAFAKYTPLANRERTDNYEIINARWLAKKGAKRNTKEAQSNE